MKEAIDFLRKHADIALATVGADKKPKIRAFEIMKMDERSNSLYFTTSDDKEVYTQIQSNPHVELLAMEGSVSVRITGMVSFDVASTVAQSIFDNNAILQRLYPDYTRLEYFRVIMQSIEYYDLSADPPIQENYTLS